MEPKVSNLHGACHLYYHSIIYYRPVKGIILRKGQKKLSAPLEALKKAGAIDVYVFITHAVLSGEAAQKIKKSKIKKLIITDTIDNSFKIKNNSKIEVISIAPLMAEAINRISNSTSVSDLFN